MLFVVLLFLFVCLLNDRMNKVVYASIICAICAVGGALLHVSRPYAILLCVSVRPFFLNQNFLPRVHSCLLKKRWHNSCAGLLQRFTQSRDAWASLCVLGSQARTSTRSTAQHRTMPSSRPRHQTCQSPRALLSVQSICAV